jgi:hypothetical protein
VYRVSFALVVFFLTMTLLTRCIPLAHRGGFPIKLLVAAAFIVLSFLIPNRTCACLPAARHHPRASRARTVRSAHSLSYRPLSRARAAVWAVRRP